MRPSLGALLAAAVGCAPPAEQAAAPPAVDTAGVTQALSTVWSSLSAAVTSENMDAIMPLYHSAARIDEPGLPPMIGSAMMDSVLRPVLAARDYTSLDVVPHTTTVVSNDLAYQAGTYSESFVEGGKTTMIYGRWASAIAKDSTGQWRIGYLMAFPDSTVAGR